MVDVTADDFDRLFSDALKTMQPLVDGEALQEAGGDQTDEEGEPIRGVGQAMEGYVKVTAKPGGEIEAVEINPRALRDGSEELAEAFKNATNNAYADLQENLKKVIPEAPDQQQLMERLKEFQNESVNQMQRFLTAITDVQDSIDKIGKD